MDTDAIIFADQPPLRAVRSRLTRREAGRALAAPRHRHLALRRAALLAAAIAVPALAAPGAFHPGEPASAIAHAQPHTDVAASGWMPGADGSLAQAALAAEGPLTAGELAVLGTSATTELGGDALQTAAPALQIAGSDTDHARAQRCMTQAIYYEAATEPEVGQRAVAQVVLNRVAHPAWPNTVCGVVYQGSERTTGCQFTFTCDGSLARQPSPTYWVRASRIAREALAGVVYAPVGLATHYHTLAVNPYWADSLDKVGVIGAHQFYRWRGPAGSRAAFTMRHRGGEPMPGRLQATPPAPDPLRPPLLPEFAEPALASLPPASALPVTYLAPAPPPAPASTPVASASPANNLPASGSVRSEYAASGQWLNQP